MSGRRCRVVQQNDEYYCTLCRLRWDVNDPDPPKCGQDNAKSEAKETRSK